MLMGGGVKDDIGLVFLKTVQQRRRIGYRSYFNYKINVQIRCT